MAITIIKNGDSHNHGMNHHEYQITSRSDVASLPTTCAPSSKAYPADRSYCYVLSNEGVLTEVNAVYDWGTI